jgi:hypothetical protein
LGAALDHDALVDSWVLNALARSRTLVELVSLLPGVVPSDVAKSLARIGAALPAGASEKLLRLPGPSPHPVDADWRFHPESHQYLTTVIQKHQAATVALLACPSLAEHCTEVARRVAVVDANDSWAEHLKGISVEACWGDVGAVTGRWSAEFDLVVVDPPWYSIDFERFLTVAATIVRSRGTILLSWPAEGTRPGISADWEIVHERATALGLSCVSRERLALRYATPFFEARAMQAALLPVMSAWRRADVAIFVRNGKGSVDVAPYHSTQWLKTRFGSLDVRARRSNGISAIADPKLCNLIEGDVLPTVSRRDPRRDSAIVWTGGNRIFGCTRPDLLTAIAAGLSRGASGGTAVAQAVGRTLSVDEEEWAVEAEAQIRNLESSEAAEYDALHGEPSSSQ